MAHLRLLALALCSTLLAAGCASNAPAASEAKTTPAEHASPTSPVGAGTTASTPASAATTPLPLQPTQTSGAAPVAEPPPASSPPAVVPTSPSAPSAPTPPPDDGSIPIDWATNATLRAGTVGTRDAFRCPANGTTVARAWGTDVYAMGSAVCVVGVHAGVINATAGGLVTVEYRPAAECYSGSSRNSVTTADAAPWTRSFVVIGAPTGPGDACKWGFTAAQHATAALGATFAYACPPNGRPYDVWGTDEYADASAVCTAAAHAGLVTFALGGSVTIEMQPGLSCFTGTGRNGVVSLSSSTWTGAFFLVGAPNGAGNACLSRGTSDPASWEATLAEKPGAADHQTFRCAPGGAPTGSIWGTDTYTDDSGICLAAVHAGLITKAGGGLVTVERRPGLVCYSGSTRHGVASNGYSAWERSFLVLGSAGTEGDHCKWGLAASTHRGAAAGERFVYVCPAGGEALGSVWGTGLYTDDSAVCPAAVHAGAITFAAGGPVTIELREGQGCYQGSTRHGVASNGYSSWDVSFAIVGGDVVGNVC